MTARRTYSLACEGPACTNTFTPAMRLDQYGRPKVAEQLMEVRHEAKQAGWKTTFLPGPPRVMGHYSDHCPGCKHLALGEART